MLIEPCVCVAKFVLNLLKLFFTLCNQFFFHFKKIRALLDVVEAALAEGCKDYVLLALEYGANLSDSEAILEHRGAAFLSFSCNEYPAFPKQRMFWQLC